ncbi:hypothetical protein [Cryobacterium sp. TMT2-15-1]|uniref:hypothetical protein n=1 Tax=Cryobacterium sp. TMT2-15-1 TaxID=1259246 RepID=UPI00141B9EB6|nr:hypothetical protein [Cryobacterium sp. TMT2-15-1]
MVREIPYRSAIRAFGTPSAANLRINAQSSKVITLQSSSVHFSSVETVQFSSVIDSWFQMLGWCRGSGSGRRRQRRAGERPSQVVFPSSGAVRLDCEFDAFGLGDEECGDALELGCEIRTPRQVDQSFIRYTPSVHRYSVMHPPTLIERHRRCVPA